MCMFRRCKGARFTSNLIPTIRRFCRCYPTRFIGYIFQLETLPLESIISLRILPILALKAQSVAVLVSASTIVTVPVPEVVPAP